MANIISESVFNKVANFFGVENVRRAKNGGTSIIVAPRNTVIKDFRSNTVYYALYLYDDGFRWRRMVLNIFDEIKPYQLFRYAHETYVDEYGYRCAVPESIVYHSFATVEEALARFAKYANNIKMAD